MRLTIPQPQFLKSLQTVERAVNERSPLPILTNVLLETTKDELILTATDLDVGIRCRFPLVPPVEPGAVTLPARKLTTVIRELPEEPVVLESKKNHTATVTCGASSFRIPGLPAEDFPTLPSPHEADALALPQGAMKRLIILTAHAMSMEETRFILNGALLTTQNSSLVMVATDGRRLAIARTAPDRAAKTPLQVVIPSKTIRELGRLLQDDDAEELVISPIADNQLTFRFGPVTIISRLIEGQFPPYEKVIPPPSKTVMSCSRQALTDAIRRASLMTTATSQAVVFELGPNQLVVSKESPELGSAREELPVVYHGEPMTIAFNPEFWLDVLRTLETDEVTVELAEAAHREAAEPERRAVIRQPEFTYLVMPMKIG